MPLVKYGALFGDMSLPSDSEDSWSLATETTSIHSDMSEYTQLQLLHRHCRPQRIDEWRMYRRKSDSAWLPVGTVSGGPLQPAPFFFALKSLLTYAYNANEPCNAYDPAGDSVDGRAA